MRCWTTGERGRGEGKGSREGQVQRSGECKVAKVKEMGIWKGGLCTVKEGEGYGQ